MITLNTLIESYSCSFGRVTEITSVGFGVTYSYAHNQKVIYYNQKDLDNNIIKIVSEN